MNEPRTITRRRLLAVLGGGAAAAAGARYLSPSPHDRLTTAGLMTPGSVGPAADPNLHRLVVIEMSGGCDGLSLAVPFGDPRYYDLRARTAVTPDEVLKIDDRVGIRRSRVCTGEASRSSKVLARQIPMSRTSPCSIAGGQVTPRAELRWQQDSWVGCATRSATHPRQRPASRSGAARAERWLRIVRPPSRSRTSRPPQYSRQVMTPR
jgi:hypothetical protein